jgi:F-type H+-transporting ATPase subunit epsilon
MEIDVLILSPTGVIFEGKAGSVTLPGEQGVFEILPFHKAILSRLISGTLFVGEQSVSIQRGLVSVNQNKVTIIVEESG